MTFFGRRLGLVERFALEMDRLRSDVIGKRNRPLSSIGNLGVSDRNKNRTFDHPANHPTHAPDLKFIVEILFSTQQWQWMFDLCKFVWNSFYFYLALCHCPSCPFFYSVNWKVLRGFPYLIRDLFWRVFTWTGKEETASQAIEGGVVRKMDFPRGEIDVLSRSQNLCGQIYCLWFPLHSSVKSTLRCCQFFNPNWSISEMIRMRSNLSLPGDCRNWLLCRSPFVRFGSIAQ